ncbi:MAG: hypothetical protein ABI333_22470 [bacterium]
MDRTTRASLPRRFTPILRGLLMSLLLGAGALLCLGSGGSRRGGYGGGGGYTYSRSSYRYRSSRSYSTGRSSYRSGSRYRRSSYSSSYRRPSYSSPRSSYSYYRSRQRQQTFKRDFHRKLNSNSRNNYYRQQRYNSWRRSTYGRR